MSVSISSVSSLLNFPCVFSMWYFNLSTTVNPLLQISQKTFLEFLFVFKWTVLTCRFRLRWSKNFLGQVSHKNDFRSWKQNKKWIPLYLHHRYLMEVDCTSSQLKSAKLKDEEMKKYAIDTFNCNDTIAYIDRVRLKTPIKNFKQILLLFFFKFPHNNAGNHVRIF